MGAAARRRRRPRRAPRDGGVDRSLHPKRGRPRWRPTRTKEGPRSAASCPTTTPTRSPSGSREGRSHSTSVYRAREAGAVFLVVELLDPERLRCLLVVAAYPLAEAAGIYGSTAGDSPLRTRLRRLAETVVASSEHEDGEKFFPSDAGGRAGRRG